MKILLQLLFLIGALAANAQPARIIFIRHAEKPADQQNPHLSAPGRDRAERVIKWLSEGKILGTNGAPVALYAAAPTAAGRNLRCVETLEPTARHLGLTVQTPRGRGDFAGLARDLLCDTSLRGKNVVVCWVHEHLPAFAAAVGVNPPPPKWKDGDYDSAYVVTFTAGKATLDRKNEKLKSLK